MIKANLSLSVTVDCGTSLEEAVESSEHLLMSLPTLSSVDFKFNGVNVIITRSSSARHLRAWEDDLLTRFGDCMKNSKTLIV